MACAECVCKLRVRSDTVVQKVENIFFFFDKAKRHYINFLRFLSLSLASSGSQYLIKKGKQGLYSTV